MTATISADTPAAGPSASDTPPAAVERVPETMTLIVTAIDRPTPDIRTFHLAAVDGAALPAFVAGSHLVVHTPSGANAYSLTGDGTHPTSYSISVLRIEDGTGGFLLNDIGIHDYAGGTAVHMNSGVAALALALVLGARRRRMERPNNVPLALLGGGILWFGWFGFNGSCALGASFLTQVVILNTLLAGGAGMIGFCLIERLREGHVTSLGLITGAVAGLVGITPAANTMTPLGALGVGILAAAVVAFMLSFKSRLKVDDSLDAFAVHGVGGIVGTLCIVLFASESAPAGVEGILFGGDISILWKELAGIVITCTFSFVMTYLIAKALDKTMGLRVDEETEIEGLDSTIHAETAYEIPAAGVGHAPGLTSALLSKSAKHASEAEPQVSTSTA